MLFRAPEGWSMGREGVICGSPLFVFLTRRALMPTFLQAQGPLPDPAAYSSSGASRTSAPAPLIKGYRSGWSTESIERSTSRSGQRRWPDLGRSIQASCAIVASRNHGKASNGRNYSRSSTSSHTPWGDTLVSSTAEVGPPLIPAPPSSVPHRAARRKLPPVSPRRVLARSENEAADPTRNRSAARV